MNNNAIDPLAELTLTGQFIRFMSRPTQTLSKAAWVH